MRYGIALLIRLRKTGRINPELIVATSINGKVPAPNQNMNWAEANGQEVLIAPAKAR